VYLTTASPKDARKIIVDLGYHKIDKVTITNPFETLLRKDKLYCEIYDSKVNMPKWENYKRPAQPWWKIEESDKIPNFRALTEIAVGFVEVYPPGSTKWCLKQLVLP